jgi:hypothetical protein
MDLPLHRFNQIQSHVWITNPIARRVMASELVKRYPGGVGVLDWKLRLICRVQPNGAVEILRPPYQRYEMWQVANAPKAEACPCGDFFDPESKGPWKDRARPGEHHPFCQFDRTAIRVFDAAMNQVKSGAKPRPDEWQRLRERELGLRGEKTR